MPTPTLAAAAGDDPRARRRRRRRRSGRTASPAICRSCWCASTRRRTSPSCASCCARTNTGGCKRLAVDLVILNERAASYAQDLQRALETLLRTSQSRPQIGGDARGIVYMLRADLITPEARALLLARGARRADLDARGEPLPSSSIARRSQPQARAQRAPARPPAPRPRCRRRSPPRTCSSSTASAASPPTAANMSRSLERGQTTPAPWINVIANPQFGFQVIGRRRRLSPGRSTASRTSSHRGRTTRSTERAGEAIYLQRSGDRRAVGSDRRARSPTPASTISRGTARATAASSTARTASRSSFCNSCRWTIRSRYRA